MLYFNLILLLLHSSLIKISQHAENVLEFLSYLFFDSYFLFFSHFGILSPFLCYSVIFYSKHLVPIIAQIKFILSIILKMYIIVGQPLHYHLIDLISLFLNMSAFMSELWAIIPFNDASFFVI